MVTIRSSSSELSSPALKSGVSYWGRWDEIVDFEPFVEIDICLFADQVGVPATDTLDLSQGVHDLALAIDVCVEETQNVLLKTKRWYKTGTAFGW